MRPMKFAIKTLGCKVNQYEAQVLRENLSRFGYEESAPGEADLFVVNSCTVTAQADVKTRRLIKKIKKDNPHVKIFVTGCAAVFDEDVEKLRSMEEVYEVVRNSDKTKLPLLVDSTRGVSHGEEELTEEVSGFSSHTRAFLKVQDGCDQKCSYCKVNLVRGPSRSRDEKEILSEVKRLAAGGFREIVLTGICLGSWKGDSGRDLSALLCEINGIEEDFRIRLSSIEPNHVDSRLIDEVASLDKVCNHLHIPLQSGSDIVLEKMKRRYNTAQFQDMVTRLREKIPLIGLTMDIICGFPGETEEDFYMTLETVRRINPSRLHVFKYSDRKGTGSFLMKDKVPSSVAKDRVSLLIKLGYDLQRKFCESFVDKQVEVLIEDESDTLRGYTGEYVHARMESAAQKGLLIQAKVKSVDKDELCLVVGMC